LQLPRDLSGDQLTKLLRRFGYEVARQAAGILGDNARYVEMDRDELAKSLFDR